MSQTCLTQAAHALHTCHLHAIHRRHTFHMNTFINAQAYCTTCKNAISSHDVCMVHARNTHLHHICHICHIHKYAAGMPKTHTMCILHANRMPHMHACMPHLYYICRMHTIVMHTAHTYSVCMHTIPTYTGYLLLHVYYMQNTCKYFL
jgi:hypothetical protein